MCLLVPHAKEVWLRNLLLAACILFVQWHLKDFLSNLFSLAVKEDFLLQQESNLFFRSQPVLYCLDEEKPVEEKQFCSWAMETSPAGNLLWPTCPFPAIAPLLWSCFWRRICRYVVLMQAVSGRWAHLFIRVHDVEEELWYMHLFSCHTVAVVMFRISFCTRFLGTSEGRNLPLELPALFIFKVHYNH